MSSQYPSLAHEAFQFIFNIILVNIWETSLKSSNLGGTDWISVIKAAVLNTVPVHNMATMYISILYIYGLTILNLIPYDLMAKAILGKVTTGSCWFCQTKYLFQHIF